MLEDLGSIDKHAYISGSFQQSISILYIMAIKNTFWLIFPYITYFKAILYFDHIKIAKLSLTATTLKYIMLENIFKFYGKKIEIFKS